MLFILVDAMRADRLGCYGYDRPTSPNLDALAEEGVIFTDAVAPAAWTQVSIPSLMTGRRPREHGIGWTQEGDQVYMQHGTKLPMLAEVLHEHGYRTAAFCANQIVGKDTGRLIKHPADFI